LQFIGVESRMMLKRIWEKGNKRAGNDIILLRKKTSGGIL
jgi:hypothetical protein